MNDECESSAGQSGAGGGCSSLATCHCSCHSSLATCHGSFAATLRATRGLGFGRRLLDPGKRPERLQQLGLGPDLPVQLIEEDALHDFLELGTGRQTHRLKLGARQLGAHLRELEEIILAAFEIPSTLATVPAGLLLASQESGPRQA